MAADATARQSNPYAGAYSLAVSDAITGTLPHSHSFAVAHAITDSFARPDVNANTCGDNHSRTHDHAPLVLGRAVTARSPQ